MKTKANAAKSGIIALQIHAGHPMMAQFKKHPHQNARIGFIMTKILRVVALLTVVLLVVWPLVRDAADKKIVLVAGKPSHGPGEHEFNAGFYS